MHDLYEQTALTPLRAARMTGYIDWNMQPSIFKHYPDGLFSYALDDRSLPQIVRSARCVTSHATMGNRPYLRLNTPSAGNLHPLELYVQMRGIKGIISGIYHIDAAENRAVLIKEIEDDGIEPYLGVEQRLRGMIFILSCVPFRSVWKYKMRAWRYCYMDAGHQLGSLMAAAVDEAHELTILSGFDAECLEKVLGFVSQESVIAAISCGMQSDRRCQPLRAPLMQVQPTDYFEGDDLFAIHRREVADHTVGELEIPVDPKALDDAQTWRRSARYFNALPLPSAMVQSLLQRCSTPPSSLDCHVVILRGEGYEPGLYHHGELVRSGAFSETITSLLVDQQFVKNAAMVGILTSERFDANALMKAGLFSQALYLLSSHHKIGYSAIGAFYDRKLQHFLETDNYILYAFVIGMPEN